MQKYGQRERLTATVSTYTVDWSDPGAQRLPQCFCSNRDLYDRWWSCFYKKVPQCPVEDTKETEWYLA